ncbi:MAG: cyclic-phosphate processing receiver domain-containing protein [Campylobacterota bacterium]|nr:cyclic-phosphate processing receiver domain-containing protein [Campylobacterota bacterium]
MISKTKTKLYLDDIRSPKSDGYTIVRSFEDAVKFIEDNNIPEYISFDHDLGIDKNGGLLPTGYDFAKWLIEMDLDNIYQFPNNFEYNVHSANPIGKHNIETILDNYLNFKIKYKDEN